MNRKRAASFNLSMITAGVLMATPCLSYAEDFSFVEAMKNGESTIAFRSRFERVEQAGMIESADALTLRSRISFKSKPFDGWHFTLEADNVSSIGKENYNSTSNGRTEYPVVADPTGTDLNQASLTYSSDKLTAVIGRQRINLDNQRFVGGVGWRQNEQTYDAMLVSYKATEQLTAAYAYVHNVNRIFGPTGANSDIFGDHHILKMDYEFDAHHKLGLIGIFLDAENAAAIGSSTVGIDYQGKSGISSWQLAFAQQSDDGKAPVDYSADYLLAEFNVKLDSVKVGLGYEVLGSDNGVTAFTTPLATLHKFQGFADKFLGTPANGVEDLYAKVSGKVSGATLTAIYHRFASDFGNIDYGTELDLVASFKLDNHHSFLVKYASYSAKDFSTDTDKIWLMMSAQF